MSISTQGGNQRRPSVVSTGKKAPAGGKPASDEPSSSEATPADKTRPAGNGKTSGGAKSAAGGGRPGGKGPRKPIAPVKVSQERAWGPIALFVAVGVLTAGIIGYGAYAVYQGGRGWEDRAAGISGLVNFRKSDPSKVQPLEGKQSHEWGPLTYAVNPPVGSSHNFNWQNCMGDVYDAPIANEHAVHSLEHGAVWITYRSDLPADQVEKLASKVRGNEYMMMSPVDNLDKAVSLQAWGFQLKVDEADDSRIDDFVSALRLNASVEPGSTCCFGDHRHRHDAA